MVKYKIYPKLCIWVAENTIERIERIERIELIEMVEMIVSSQLCSGKQ